MVKKLLLFAIFMFFPFNIKQIEPTQKDSVPEPEIIDEIVEEEISDENLDVIIEYYRDEYFIDGDDSEKCIEGLDPEIIDIEEENAVS